MVAQLDDIVGFPVGLQVEAAGTIRGVYSLLQQGTLNLEQVLGLTIVRKTTVNFTRELLYAGEQVPCVLKGFTRNKGPKQYEEYDDIRKTIDMLVENAPDNKMVIVGYSLGGLHARAYAQQYPEHVALCFMVATPQKGTPTAIIGRLLIFANAYGQSVEQMMPNNPWIRELNRQYQRHRAIFEEHGTRFVNFRAEHDELVPQPYSELPHVDAEYRFGGLGHLSAIHSARLYHHLVKEIRDNSDKLYPILLLHGFGVDEHIFKRLRRQLEQHHPDIAERVHAISYDYTKPVLFNGASQR
ncbi:alpha/beta fold hydrolase [Candidatus Woesearchaeota archaeon]|nr:alpha/beta fold hydrolase [Candidatus Woesearchaeota archaeon]